MFNFNIGSQKSKPLKLSYFLSSSALLSFTLIIPLFLPSLTHAQHPPRDRASRVSSPVATVTNSETPETKSDCEVANEQIAHIQKKLFDMKDPSGDQTYLDLLRERDELSSRKVMLETLVNLWDQYYDYLNDSENLRNTSPEARNSISGLMDLRNLITNNGQAVQKYQLVTDVFNSINPDEINGASAQENFSLLKNRLMQSCSNGQEHLMHCQMAINAQKDGINIWDNIQPGRPPSTTASSREAMLHKFIEVSSTALGNETLGWFKNISSMFVDNESLRYDMVGNGDLSQSVVSTLDRVVEECRKQALLTDSAVNCMNKDLSDILPEGQSFDHLSFIQSSLGQEVTTAQGLVNKYLQNVERVSSAHEEIAGGTIDRFTELAVRRHEISAQLATADTTLSRSSHNAQQDLINASAIEVTKLAKHVKILKKNDQLYRNYEEDPTDPKNLAQEANKELRDILALFPGNHSEVENLFFNAASNDRSGESTLGVRPEKLFAFFRNNNISKVQLQNILNRGINGKSLEENIADIDKKLEAFNSNPEHQVLEGLKVFAWKKSIDKCRGSSQFQMSEMSNSECVESNFSEVDNLLKVGNQIISYQTNQENQYNINNLNDSCEELSRNQADLYRQSYSEICTEVDLKRREIAKEEEYLSDRKVTQRMRRNIRYDPSGREKLYEYQSKSWAQIFPGALQNAMPAGMQLGQTWANTYNIKSQMLGYTTYAKNRYNYLEQQYNQGVAICSTTMSCYFNSQYQAFLPSYGGGLSTNNFGSGAFTTNSSTFFAQ